MFNKRILTIIVILAMTLGISCPAFAISQEEPVTQSPNIVMIDGKSGDVIYNKEGEAQIFPASTTKLLTAILVVEKLKLNKEVTVPELPTFGEGVTMKLVEGEVLKVQDLLWGLLIESANDAAVVLAIEVSGSVEEFSKLMNERAKEIGATKSNFVNPNGMPDSSHVSTALDMAMIGKEAMNKKTIKNMVNVKSHNMSATNKSGPRAMKNTNKLISGNGNVDVNGVSKPLKYKYAIGGKTGYTGEAGRNLVGVSEKDETRLIVATFGGGEDPIRYTDAIALFDYGFANYRTFTIEEPGSKIAKFKVKHGSSPKIWAVAPDGVYVTLPKEGADNLADTQVVFKEINAPIKEGDKVGILKTYAGDKLMGQVDLVASKSVKKGGPWTLIGISDFLFILIVVLIIVVFLGLNITRRIVRKRNAKKRRAIETIRKKRQEEEEKRQAIKRERDTQRNWPFN